MKTRNTFILLLAAVVTACTQSNQNEPSSDDGRSNAMTNIDITYPKTAKTDHSDNYFGTEVPDPYRWLEAEDSAAVAEWVETQNEVTFGYLEQIPYREKIRQRLEEIWNYPKYGAPFREGDHYFFYKNDGLQDQAVLYIMDDLGDEPRVFLDPNTFSGDGTASLTTFEVSRNGKYAAYGVSEGGSDWNEFFVKDVETGDLLDDHIRWIKFSGAAWKDDGFYYGRFEAPGEGKELSSKNEGKQIYYHKLGTDQSEDRLIFEDPSRPKMGIYAATTEDERFLLLYMTMGATSDNALKIKDLSKPESGFKDLITTFDHSYDVVENIGNTLFVVTNDGASRKRLVSIDLDRPGKEHWKEIIPEREEVLISVSMVGGKLYAQYLKDASSRIYIYSTDGDPLGEVELPGIGTVVGFNGKKDDAIAFYTFTSFTYPSTIFKYDTRTGESVVFRKSGVDFDPEAYETKQVFFKSKDGTDVPVFIVHKKGLELDGDNPCLLYGYGGFNINILPTFSISNIILLENGGIYAVATLRGGGEYGEQWHKSGMLHDKQNVFDDFIGAAEYLIDNKYTSPEKLGIYGRSNGGLLVGAAMCQRPDLFAVALPAVGVMDMLRYHKFTIGHAWAVEYGRSDQEEHFANLYNYSPLHNLEEGTEYPSTMVITADHDDRVVPAHSFKFIARLQEVQAGEDPVLIRIETMAGHGAGKPTSKIIEEMADMWTFFFFNTGTNVIY